MIVMLTQLNKLVSIHLALFETTPMRFFVIHQTNPFYKSAPSTTNNNHSINWLPGHRYLPSYRLRSYSVRLSRENIASRQKKKKKKINQPPKNLHVCEYSNKKTWLFIHWCKLIYENVLQIPVDAYSVDVDPS